MSTEARKLLDEALALPKEERVEMIDALTDSLERPDDELGPGWGEEIARRLGALERGESKLIPGHEVSARIRAALESVEHG